MLSADDVGDAAATGSTSDEDDASEVLTLTTSAPPELAVRGAGVGPARSVFCLAAVDELDGAPRYGQRMAVRSCDGLYLGSEHKQFSSFSKRSKEQPAFLTPMFDNRCVW
ncbi:hypothetical protein HK405_004523 [Cladochytrium tenue]|nr:hypothetical protein HK405_004523 [Cladochytrium tenue]